MSVIATLDLGVMFGSSDFREFIVASAAAVA
jgi:hypothetical protein